MPKAATAAISPSAITAPTPAANPPQKPRSNVLWIQTILTGPTGAAMSTPTINPLSTSWEVVVTASGCSTVGWPSS
jgi:hypothetical protein